MSERRWNKPVYQRIVRVENAGTELLIEFQDKSKIKLERNTLLPPNVGQPDWAAVGFNPYELVIPTSSGDVEISWSTIRLLSDPEYAAYWTQMAEEEAKDIGRRLRALRKGRNLSSKEVAERAGISPQSLSRIEQGHHDVVFTTLNKILASMGCSLQDLANTKPEPLKFSSLFKKLESAGIRREWLLRRILPPDIVSKLDNHRSGEQELIDDVAAYVCRIFNCSIESVTDTNPLALDLSLVKAAKFKKLPRTEEKYITAYAFYAHYIALLALQATELIQPRALPRRPDIIKKEIISAYGSLTLQNMLRYVWDHGIAVVPLSDPGTFHGACWNVSGRFVIVLKQVTEFQGRWLFDLSHEVGHIRKHLALTKGMTGVIEAEEITPFESIKEEWEASDFASELLFSGRAEELAELCITAAGGSVEKLKSAVIRVASSEHVPVDLLANYMAFRLSKANRINWWGAANNLQVTDPSPWLVTKQMLLERIKPERLSPDDFKLLMRAFEE